MASADTLCKKLFGAKSAVVTGHNFYPLTSSNFIGS